MSLSRRIDLSKSFMLAVPAQREESSATAAEHLNGSASAEFRGNLDFSFGSDMHSISFQEISAILRAKPDMNVFYRTPCLGSNRFSRRSSSLRTAIDYLSQLPDAMLLRIFSNLNKRDIVSVLLVCRRFSHIGRDQTLWEYMNLGSVLIDEETIHSLLDRRMRVLRLANSEIRSPTLFPWFDFQNLQQAQLTHLDLSHAKFSQVTVCRLLSRCKTLQALSLEYCELVNDECCREISKNADLKYLDLVYAKCLTAVGIGSILRGCRRLAELNLGWAEFESGAIEMICQFTSPRMRCLNLSGFRDLEAMNDTNIERLCNAYKNLEVLDLSDNTILTEHCLEPICSHLHRLKKLTLSRCYGIEPVGFLSLGHLKELNVYGCITENGVNVLRNRLAPTKINASPFSTIAKPTVGESISSIWQERTRDLY